MPFLSVPGSLVLQLVRDVLVHCGMKETLAVFEAEAGVAVSPVFTSTLAGFHDTLSLVGFAR
jgi:hypothetical protein